MQKNFDLTQNMVSQISLDKNPYLLKETHGWYDHISVNLSEYDYYINEIKLVKTII